MIQKAQSLFIIEEAENFDFKMSLTIDFKNSAHMVVLNIGRYGLAGFFCGLIQPVNFAYFIDEDAE